MGFTSPVFAKKHGGDEMFVILGHLTIWFCKFLDFLGDVSQIQASIEEEMLIFACVLPDNFA